MATPELQRPPVVLAESLLLAEAILRILEQHDDAALHRLMTNLAGNDMQAVVDAFEGVNDDTPTCFIAYTIKGQGLLTEVFSKRSPTELPGSLGIGHVRYPTAGCDAAAAIG